VPYIDRKGFIVEGNSFNISRQGGAATEFQQFLPHLNFFTSRQVSRRLNTNNGPFVAFFANSNEGCARNFFVRIKDGFAGDGEKRFVGGCHPMALATAKPDTPLFIEIA
jgi:hypothetical protein